MLDYEEQDQSKKTHINVMLCLEPRLIRQITRKALSTIPDVRIVGDCRAPEKLEQDIAAKQVDWVVLGTTQDHVHPLLEERFDFLVRNPEISLLAIAVDGAHLKTWWLRLHEEVIKSPTLQDIVEVLHSGMRSHSMMEGDLNRTA